MKLFKSTILLMCLMAISVSSCKKDSDDSNEPEPVVLSPILTATIDGVPFVADESLIGGSLTFPNDVNQLVISGSNQFGTGQVSIQVYFMDVDFENFVATAEFDGENSVGDYYCLGKIDHVDITDGEGSSFSTDVAHGIITSINTQSKVISGTFTFTTLNEDDTESVITEGFFEDIGYN